MKTLLTTIIAAVTLFGAAVRSNAAAVDYFVEVDGIPGESSIPGHVGQIHLLNFTLEAFQRSLATNGGAGTASAAGAMCKPVSLIIPTDQSWPLLFRACVLGQRLKKVTIYADFFADGNGGPTGNFLTVTLENVLVSSVQLNSNERSSGGDVSETVTLNFTSVAISYRPVKPDNTFGTPVTSKFNLMSNKIGE